MVHLLLICDLCECVSMQKWVGASRVMCGVLAASSSSITLASHFFRCAAGFSFFFWFMLFAGHGCRHTQLYVYVQKTRHLNTSSIWSEATNGCVVYPETLYALANSSSVLFFFSSSFFLSCLYRYYSAQH